MKVCFFLLLVNFPSVMDPLYYVFFSRYRSVGPQPKKSISFTNTVKGGQTKGYIGANQSRMAMSKTLIVLPEIKTEKMNISTPRTVIQVIFFRILSVFENGTIKNLTEMWKVENTLLWNNQLTSYIDILVLLEFSPHNIFYSIILAVGPYNSLLIMRTLARSEESLLMTFRTSWLWY